MIKITKKSGKSCKTVEVELTIDFWGRKEKHKVTGQELSPTWAITPAVSEMGYHTPGHFQLTHRPSGLRAAGTKSRKALLKFWQGVPAWVKTRLETDSLDEITSMEFFVSNCRALIDNASAVIEWPESEEVWKKERRGEK